MAFRASFSLRTWLLGFTCIAVAIGLAMGRYHYLRATVAELENRGALVHFTYRLTKDSWNPEFQNVFPQPYSDFAPATPRLKEVESLSDFVKMLRGTAETVCLGEQATTADVQLAARFPRVTSLVVRSDTFGDDSVPSICGLNGLRQLMLISNTISGRNLGCLAALDELEYLELASDSLTAEAIGELSKLKSLKTLALMCPARVGRGATELAESLPGCRIYVGLEFQKIGGPGWIQGP